MEGYTVRVSHYQSYICAKMCVWVCVTVPAPPACGCMCATVCEVSQQ